MKLPSLQFYPGDWMKDPNLRRCSRAARGMWIDMLCLMFECEDRGILSTGGEPWSDEDIAAAIGGDTSEGLSCISELLRKGVAHRNQSGAIFSKRMVRDEQIRRERAKAGSVGGSKPKANRKQNTPPSPSPSFPPNGDGARPSIWDLGDSILVDGSGWTKKNSRSFIGRQIKDYGEEAVAEILAKISLKPKADPGAYIVETLKKTHPKNGKPMGEIKLCSECNANGMHEIEKDGQRGFIPCPKRKNGHS